MRIRPIQAEEWERLKPIYESEKGRLPNLALASASIADDEGKLAGFWGVQIVMHAGPLWIAPEYRGTGLWRPLHAVLESQFERKPGTGYFIFSGQPKMETIAGQLGFASLDYKLWKREF